MKHRAPQFDLPGTEQPFNLANGEGIDWQARQIEKERFDALRRTLESNQLDLFDGTTNKTPQPGKDTTA